MKILFCPNLIVSALGAADRAAILDAAGPSSRIVEVTDAAGQKRELPDTDVIFGRVHPDHFSLATRLGYYHAIGAGVDSILTPELVNSDVPLASEKGDVGVHLSEHAFALLLGLTRGVHTALRTPDYGLREPIRVHQRELFEQTMGVVGFGGTGRAVARRAVAFGMRVLGVDIERVEPEPGVEAIWGADRLADLLRASDVVVIALPLTKATHHLFTRERFAQMQRHAILINVTRGEIVRGEDLLAALDEEVIWGRRARRDRSRAAARGPSAVAAPAGHRHAAHGGRIAPPRGPGDRDLLREPAAAPQWPAAPRADRQAEGLLG